MVVLQKTKRDIDQILNLPFGHMQKALLILVAAGKKRATDIVLYPKHTMLLPSIIAVLKTNALQYAIQPHQGISDATGTLMIAQKQADAQRLVALHIARDPLQYGLLMGYPKTAVHAYQDKRNVYIGYGQSAHPPELNNNLFTGIFYLSKEHYRKEMKILVQWDTYIRKHYSELYDALSKEFFKSAV